MTTFLVVCGQQIDINRRVVTFLEPGAPNFYTAREEMQMPLLSQRPGVPATADISLLAKRVSMICIHHDAT